MTFATYDVILKKKVKNINSKRNKNSLKKQENLQLRYLREFSFIHKDVVYRVCDVLTFYKRLKAYNKREAGERMYRIAEMSSTEIFIGKNA